ncbi:hypothetical protein [Pelomicrobium methylotrophicum]|uniref:Uncharacterized protein n=1 Tax=Pelomicrobium methylotrophicum TaxID=2602750 RepID=A0A5C7EG89_9PROT|nr:hypothetical protein [Pelomicrobium methylotrophicum]TXF10040.1 hypothetical protein FR698_15855 [Pelomicrobium methylotrophicum]
MEYVQGMEEHVPGLEALLMLGCSHFVTRERPAEMANAMMWFYYSMLTLGFPLFDRSRHYGLPIRPVRPAVEGWGVNPLRLDLTFQP